MPSTSSVSLTGNTDIDGILSGVKWTSPTITFSFPTALSQFGYTETGFEAMNATQMTAVRAILAQYESVSGLKFTEVTESSTVHGTIRFAEEDNAGTAYGYYPSSAVQGGDIWLNHTDYNNPLKGTYAYATFLHEIGHTLGLDHGQDGTAALPYDHDSLEYSVMTYRSYVGAGLTGYTAAQGSYPQTLMIDDIAAIQYMYGANYTTNSGDTVYTWSATTGAMSINGTSQGASTTNTIFQSLWDGGGVDTYDFSNYTTNLSVDLSPGGWTTTSSSQLATLGFSGQKARGNIANAYLYNNNTASLIENAKGGSGNDTIRGNQANNVLDGGTGNDTLTGGLGNDTIIGGIGVDTCVIGVNRVACTVTYDDITGLFTLSSLLEGIDTLNGVEYVQFLDGTISTSSLVGPDLSNPLLLSSTPADNAGTVAVGANIVLAFNESVVAGSGSITIYNSDGSVFATCAANDTSKVTISGGTVTINPSTDLLASTAYYVLVDSTAFQDTSGNAYDGISSDTVLNFTTSAPAPIAPSVINGTSSNNTLNGTVGDDAINGKSGNDTLNGLAGKDTLDGGAGYDTMSGGNDDDTYIVDSTRDVVKENANEGTDTVKSSVTFTLGANVEYLTLTGSNAINGTGNALGNLIIGNSAANILSGNDGMDVLKGMGGNDTLLGGTGNDALFGGNGNDTLTGGTGQDAFVFDTALSARYNLDKISDFSVVDDYIALDNTIFTALSDGNLNASEFGIGSSAANSSIHVFYNSATGGLYYDADGNGTGAAIQFATLSKNLALTSADFFVL